MNKRNIILTIVIALFVAFGIYSQKSQELEDELAEISNSPYDVSQFDEISDQEFLNADNSLNAFVYIGREDCIGCKVLAQVLTQISKENDIKISYFDTKKYRDSKSYKKIVDKYQIEQVPDFLLVKKDGTYEKFGQENIENEEKFEDWIIENKDSL